MYNNELDDDLLDQFNNEYDKCELETDLKKLNKHLHVLLKIYKQYQSLNDANVEYLTNMAVLFNTILQKNNMETFQDYISEDET